MLDNSIIKKLKDNIKKYIIMQLKTNNWWLGFKKHNEISVNM